MADIVISGNTSGSVTLRAPDIAGSPILTLPTTSGTIVTTGSATSLTTSGNLTFTGTGNRITGDFSNATVANRVLFQNSVTNGNTVIGAIPNGTATGAAFVAYNSNDPSNASFMDIRAQQATDVRLTSGINGTGTYLPLTMYTGGSERLRIDTSGNVGIGTANPAARLDVRGSGIGARIYGGGETTSTLEVAGLSSGADNATISSAYNINFQVDNTGSVGGRSFAWRDGGKGYTDGTLIMSVAKGNSLALQGATFKSGTGITFPATQSASSDANTLDDYEEGTYTVTATATSGSITSYNSSGKYTKIGNVVHVFAAVELVNVGTATSQLRITLPFNPSYLNGRDQPGAIVRESNSTGVIYFGTISTGNNQITVQNSTNGGISWTNGYYYPIQITYFV